MESAIDSLVMNPKAAKWWEKEYDKACALAALYCCNLTLDQFCAARGLEREEHDILWQHLLKQKSISL